jgi:uncharacterized protein YbjT (DUF2867 family)
MIGEGAVDRILVTGATGKVGRELVPLLVEAGVEVKAATRDPVSARSHFGSAVEVVELDYRRTETYDAALQWADRVFLMPPPFDPDALEAIGPFLDWAVSARVEHIVLLSGMTVPDVGEDLALRRMEMHLEAQDTPHAILRPNLYMQNFHPGFLWREIRAEGRIRLPAGEGRVSFVDVRDVAAVAASVLQGRPGRITSAVLTGPETLSIEDAARVISDAAGRPVRYEPVRDAAFRDALDGQGWRPAEIDVILGVFSSIRKGWREPVHPDAERILGRVPRSFAAFAEEYAGAWT